MTKRSPLRLTQTLPGRPTSNTAWWTSSKLEALFDGMIIVGAHQAASVYSVVAPIASAAISALPSLPPCGVLHHQIEVLIGKKRSRSS